MALTADGDELRVRRYEDELHAGTVNVVGKRERTDRERMEVSVLREEVTVERLPVEREASGAKIGEEGEVLVEERPEPKEEIRVREDAVEDRSPYVGSLVTLDTISARIPLHIGRFCGFGPTPFCGER